MDKSLVSCFLLDHDVVLLLVPGRPFTDPKIHDLEWLIGHFTLNLHYYELAFRVLLASFENFYVFTVGFVYIPVTNENVRSGVADRDPQNIWNPRKNCGSFLDATSSES